MFWWQILIYEVVLNYLNNISSTNMKYFMEWDQVYRTVFTLMENLTLNFASFQFSILSAKLYQGLIETWYWNFEKFMRPHVPISGLWISRYKRLRALLASDISMSLPNQDVKKWLWPGRSQLSEFATLFCGFDEILVQFSISYVQTAHVFKIHFFI